MTGTLSRTGEFNTGLTGPTMSPGLHDKSVSQNSMVNKGFKANGLNQPFMLSSSNGNSTRDAMRQTPTGQLPSMNGSSESTYRQQNPTAYGTDLGI